MHFPLHCHSLTQEIRLAQEMINKTYKAVPCLNKEMNVEKKLEEECRDAQRIKGIETRALQRRVALM